MAMFSSIGRHLPIHFLRPFNAIRAIPNRRERLPLTAPPSSASTIFPVCYWQVAARVAGPGGMSRNHFFAGGGRGCPRPEEREGWEED